MADVRDSRLSLAQKLLQRSIWRDVSTVAQGGCLASPLVVELDPTTCCDSACPECISGRLLNRGRFSAERLAELAHELVEAGVRAVILIGGGEPLLHAGTQRVLEILGRAGLSLGVTTNGTRIAHHFEALAEYATWTRVSVDAGSRAVYETFRPHRSGENLFDRIIDDMRRLAEHKKGALGYSFLLMRRPGNGSRPPETNAGDLLRAGRLAKEIGCDYFEIKPAYDLDHFLLPQPEDWVAAVDEQVRALEELQDESYSVLAPTTLSVILSRGATEEPKAYDRCLISELRTLITSDGAFICPYFRGDTSRRYGDPVTTPFSELWRGDARRRVMAATRPGRHCRFHCIRHASNELLYGIGRGELQAVPREDFDLFL